MIANQHENGWEVISPELDIFLDEQLENQEGLKVTKAEAEKVYAFFEWCDRLSLILCTRDLPAGERALEISTFPKGKRYDVMQNGDGNVTVVPWPFEAEEFTVNVEACYLNQVQFQDDAELTKALQEAPIKTLTWNFVK
jgi:Protein of unknown function (DUF3891)